MITGYSDSLHTQHQEASLNLSRIVECTTCTWVYIHDETKINNSGTV
jgi:hypothetical protein